MLSKKPYRYPSITFYSDTKLLKHTTVPTPSLKRRSKTFVFFNAFCRTTFGTRQFYSMCCKIYNPINKKLNIADLNKHEVKTCFAWLQKLDYHMTEDLLKQAT